MPQDLDEIWDIQNDYIHVLVDPVLGFGPVRSGWRLRGPQRRTKPTSSNLVLVILRSMQLPPQIVRCGGTVKYHWVCLDLSWGVDKGGCRVG